VRIYYLDDEAALCNIFEEFFSDNETDVSTFVEAQPFVDLCKSIPPDLVFIDYRLAETSGDKVAEKVDPKIPKVLVTGELDLPESELFIQVVAKPYKLNLLRQIIESERKP
jgi:DNA-binding NtrC family response regulator